MSSTSDVVFVDANVLVHAHDADAGVKREGALERLEELWDAGTGRLSAQVLQEFCVNATRKLRTRAARSTAREVVDTYAAWVREPTTPATVLRATAIAEWARLSLWDALIIASAGQAGAARLLREDLNAGQSMGAKLSRSLVDTDGRCASRMTSSGRMRCIGKT